MRFAATIFVSAFLLFFVQPLIGKHILPWYGGVPAVWATCLLFFQALLLLGYAYAHWLVGRFDPRRQRIIHLGLVALSVVALGLQVLLWSHPLLPGEAFKPDDPGRPVLGILAMLLSGVGLPFLVLAATSPLLQAWFHAASPDRSPYPLYSLSNLGSLMALLAYPFVIEPLIGLHAQAAAWGGVYLAFAFGLVLCARKPIRAGGGAAPDEAPGDRPGLRAGLPWVLLPAGASALLLSTTNQVSQEVAAVPLLWILPLTLYLLSFVFTFRDRPWYARSLFLPMFGLTAVGLVLIVFFGLQLPVWLQLLAYLGFLFTGCMVCHGELCRLKPAARHLTRFYLHTSAGGVLGGVFIALLAPALFSGAWEFQLTCVGVAALSWWVLARDPHSWLNAGRTALKRVAAGILVTGFAAALLVQLLQTSWDAISTSRNFYGVVQVFERYAQNPFEHQLFLRHGTAIHGVQLVHPQRRRVPTAYYTEGSGMGQAIKYKQRTRPAIKVGVIGLGIGTAAAFGRQRDRFRFYEIDPQVIALAKGEGGYFHFLADSPADVQIVAGDARLSLEREAPQRFDVLVADAFSSDAIPVHLLTDEAFALYLRHLAPDGILAFHISNRYLDLKQVIRDLAHHHGLPAILARHAEHVSYSIGSTWLLVTRDEGFLARPELREWVRRPETPLPSRESLWTDDYSNLARILKWH